MTIFWITLEKLPKNFINEVRSKIHVGQTGVIWREILTFLGAIL